QIGSDSSHPARQAAVEGHSRLPRGSDPTACFPALRLALRRRFAGPGSHFHPQIPGGKVEPFLNSPRNARVRGSFLGRGSPTPLYTKACRESIGQGSLQIRTSQGNIKIV